MSHDPNLEFLRATYDEWARGDYSHTDMFDPEVEFVTGQPEPRTYHGHAGAQQAWGYFLGAWEDFSVEAEEFIKVAEDRYVVFTHLRGRGKGSHAPTEASTANVITVRDGRILRFELHWHRDEALESAGLRTQSKR